MSPSPEATPEASFVADPAHDSADYHEKTLVSLKIEDWLTVIVMALLALITFANVLVRYFTDQSFAWTEEFSVFLMIVLALVAGSASVARNRQIRIEYFADGGPVERQRLLARFGAFMVFLLFALMAVLSARVVYDDIRLRRDDRRASACRNGGTRSGCR